MKADVIIIGSGAGGAAAAYALAGAGRQVLLLEKGLALPADGSTLDPATVLRDGQFMSREPWRDGSGNTIVPEEHFNLGGKTRWYGAALLRFAPHEFEADDAHLCLPWPIAYDDLAPYYDQAEKLLGVRVFPAEAQMSRLVAGLRRRDPAWRPSPMSLALAPEILDFAEEARHFDAFASVRGLKGDAQFNLLEPLRRNDKLQVLTGKPVTALLPSARDALVLAGVECADGSRYEAETVILAAGAMHSPRLLQDYLATAGLVSKLPCADMVGRYYKAHVLTVMLAFSPRRTADVLCKTVLVDSEAFPHSTLQTLGGNLAEEIVRSQLPAWFPGGLAGIAANRAYGLFLQTEDGSHADNRIVAGDPPRLDWDAARRLPMAVAEHGRMVATLRRQLLAQGYLAVSRAVPISGTAHACGTLVAGRDPRASVVDGAGKVHDMSNLYVADGSILPRSSRVNPALTIYAWGLRLGAHLDRVLAAPKAARRRLS